MTDFGEIAEGFLTATYHYKVTCLRFVRLQSYSSALQVGHLGKVADLADAFVTTFPAHGVALFGGFGHLLDQEVTKGAIAWAGTGNAVVGCVTTNQLNAALCSRSQVRVRTSAGELGASEGVLLL